MVLQQVLRRVGPMAVVGTTTVGASGFRKERLDAYDGISVDAGELAETTAEKFGALLTTSLEEWEQRHIRGVWLRVPTTRSEFIPVAVQRGFVPHNCEKDGIVLTRWLPEDEPNQLPANASHTVGVGCIVVDEETQKILLVQEKWGAFKGWKIPTGTVDARESIDVAALRECREETGLDVAFDKLVAIRHSHKASFGKSDLFFLCVLTCSGDTTTHLQTDEISASKWVDFDAFLLETPYPKNTPVWSRLYDHCRGTTSAVVGDVPGIYIEHFQNRVPKRSRQRPPPTTVFSPRPSPAASPSAFRRSATASASSTC